MRPALGDISAYDGQQRFYNVARRQRPGFVRIVYVFDCVEAGVSVVRRCPLQARYVRGAVGSIVTRLHNGDYGRVKARVHAFNLLAAPERAESCIAPQHIRDERNGRDAEAVSAAQTKCQDSPTDCSDSGGQCP
jgi:hypothetical protein